MAWVTLEQARPRRRRRTRPRALWVLTALLVLLLAGAGLAGLLRDDDGGGAGPPDRPPGLADLWSGEATLVLAKKWTSQGLGSPGQGAYGAHVEVVGGTWYLFNRFTTDQHCAGQGADVRQMGTQVRASTDEGVTWSAPVPILTPTPGTPWACAATDGDAVYDADSQTWRYLFQCLGDGGAWQGCYAERHDASPLGAFEPAASVPNPVITPGQLWDRICDDAADQCKRAAGQPRIADEGTFNVFPDGGDGWWVGFHGYDGTHGFRGLARTETFRHGDWAVDGEDGTPTDATLDAADASPWREHWHAGGPIGPGAASILEQSGWYYQLAEVPDMNLSCTDGQNWDLGLFRTRDLSNTTWGQWPGGNPIVYSSDPSPTGAATKCNLVYPSLFADPATGTSYLMYGRVSADPGYDGLYVYRLEWDRNRLRNGDFHTADLQRWSTLPGRSTQVSVERRPDRSPDGTPYVAFNCGAAACDGDEVLYQDVQVRPEDAGRAFAFGGTFRAESGTGQLELNALQLDARGAIVQSTTVPVTAGDAYARARGTFELEPGARSVRVQLTPRTPGTFWADNVYLIPQEGCDGARYPAC